jgi:hypothetical protein
MTIKEVISTGKLKTYQHNKSFLEVCWHHPSLEANQYYLFLFAGLNCSFVSVNIVSPKFLPVKHKAKVFVPTVNRLMKELAELK